ncbi:MAG: hypothetical protein M3O72_06255 [Verrucomicrobiota bacterium]|nr:hypothetical protein [Verrucomicrobiota bacterium]
MSISYFQDWLAEKSIRSNKPSLIRNARIGLPDFLRNDEPLPPQRHRHIMDL